MCAFHGLQQIGILFGMDSCAERKNTKISDGGWNFTIEVLGKFWEVVPSELMLKNTIRVWF